jgi:hypothetical protein
MWEHFIRSVNHQDVYGCVHSVNSACRFMVEDIRRMTSQAQSLVNMVVEGGLGTRTVGVVEEFSKGR